MTRNQGMILCDLKEMGEIDRNKIEYNGYVRGQRMDMKVWKDKLHKISSKEEVCEQKGSQGSVHCNEDINKNLDGQKEIVEK